MMLAAASIVAPAVELASSTMAATAATAAGTTHTAPVISPGTRCALRISTLQKPFRLGQLVQTLLQVICESDPTGTVQEAGSNSGSTAAAGAFPSAGSGSGGNPAPASVATVASPHNRSLSRRGLRRAGHQQRDGGSARQTLVSIAADYPLRILLAEDNLINQKMMVRSNMRARTRYTQQSVPACLRGQRTWLLILGRAALPGTLVQFLCAHLKRLSLPHVCSPVCSPVSSCSRCFVVQVMLLRKLGYEILVAGNGREALQLLESEARRGKQFEVECILMDASMDVMDGQTAAAAARAVGAVAAAAVADGGIRRSRCWCARPLSLSFLCVRLA